jgi:anti-anti-sigma factor
MAANLVIPVAQLRLEAEKKPSQITVRARGRITATTSAALGRTLGPLIPQFKRIVLDFSNVDHIDESGLDVLVNVYMRARRANCDLAIDNSRPSLKDLVLSWLRPVFEGHEEFLGMTPD